MKTNQFVALTDLLIEIRDRLPAPEHTTPKPAKYGPGPATDRVPWPQSHLGRTQYNAIGHVFTVLDAWIIGAIEDHGASEHQNEPVGRECWRSFDVDDIRRMLNDALSDLGLPTVSTPDVREEDK